MSIKPAPWYRIRLSREEYEAGESVLLESVFREAFIARNGPENAALYGVWEGDGTSYVLYFSPEARSCAAALFEAYAAEPCDPPPLARLGLICGDDRRSGSRAFEF